MMVFTHVAAGLVIASVVALSAPGFAVPALVGAVVGGVAPDLDLFAGTHRRTLHFPDLYWLPAVGFGAIAVGRPTPVAVAAAVAALTAADHSVSDWFGGGTELRPWERTSPHGVYVHLTGRWLAPRHWVRYDGAPEDLLVASVLSIPALVVYDPPVSTLVVLMLIVAASYVAIRRRLPELKERSRP
jgi:hypothetical protein